jgi:hypothetical protein
MQDRDSDEIRRQISRGAHASGSYTRGRSATEKAEKFAAIWRSNLQDGHDFDAAALRDNLFRVMNLEGIDHIALAVPDVARTAAWYVEVLGLERQHEEAWNGVPIFVGKGDTGIAIFPLDGSRPAS